MRKKKSIVDQIGFRMLTVQETADIIGCSRSTLMRWIEGGLNGLPKPFKLGRKIKFRSDEIDGFIEQSRIMNNKKEVQRYLFLDIDGVINSKASWGIFHHDLEKYNESIYHDYFNNIKVDGNSDTAINALKEINENNDYLVGLFSNEKSHGEIYDKSLVKILSEVVNKCYPNTKVILISSASDIIESDIFNKDYWSKLWGLDIIDGNAMGGCSLTRYRFMLNYLKELPSNQLWQATILDDLDCPDEVEHGYVEVNPHITSDKSSYRKLITNLFDFAITPTVLKRLV